MIPRKLFSVIPAVLTEEKRSLFLKVSNLMIPRKNLSHTDYLVKFELLYKRYS